MNAFENLFNEYLKYQAKTGKSIKLVKINQEYFEDVTKSIQQDFKIGIPYEIDDKQTKNFIFLLKEED